VAVHIRVAIPPLTDHIETSERRYAPAERIHTAKKERPRYGGVARRTDTAGPTTRIAKATAVGQLARRDSTPNSARLDGPP